jgi:hypothetical protein
MSLSILTNANINEAYALPCIAREYASPVFIRITDRQLEKMEFDLQDL